MSHKIITTNNWIKLAETPSTNSYALEILPQTPSEGTVIWAKRQTHGRGLQGNHWISPPGTNLTFSMILYPTFLTTQTLFGLSMITALSLYKTVRQWVPHRPVQVKWPNDVLIAQKKVAGILIENQWQGEKLKSSIVGIGLNVNQVSFPPEIQETATSLRHFTTDTLPLENVLASYLDHFAAYYQELSEGDFSSLQHKYLSHLYGYQTPIWLQVGTTPPQQGRVLGITPTGRLQVQFGDTVSTFSLKEIRFILSHDTEY